MRGIPVFFIKLKLSYILQLLLIPEGVQDAYLL